MFIFIKIMLLAIIFLILVSLFNINNIISKIYAIYIIAVVGIEFVIGLNILVAFYKLITFLVKNPRLNYFYLYFNLLFIIVLNNLILLRNYFSKRKIALNILFISVFFNAKSFFVITILKNLRYKIK